MWILFWLEILKMSLSVSFSLSSILALWLTQQFFFWCVSFHQSQWALCPVSQGISIIVFCYKAGRTLWGAEQNCAHATRTCLGFMFGWNGFLAFRNVQGQGRAAVPAVLWSTVWGESYNPVPLSVALWVHVVRSGAVWDLPLTSILCDH